MCSVTLIKQFAVVCLIFFSNYSKNIHAIQLRDTYVFCIFLFNYFEIAFSVLVIISIFVLKCILFIYIYTIVHRYNHVYCYRSYVLD